MLLVEMPHGPLNAISSGSSDVWLAPRLNSNVRSFDTGSCDRSGFGIIIGEAGGWTPYGYVSLKPGTTLLSGYAGLATMRNSMNLPTHGSNDPPENACATDRSFAGSLPSWCSQQFTRYSLVPSVYFEKSITMSNRSAIPCSSSSVSLIARGSRLPSLAI